MLSIDESKKYKIPMRTVAFDIMTSPVVSVRPDDTAADIAQLLATGGIRAIPVTDIIGHVVRIVSDGIFDAHCARHTHAINPGGGTYLNEASELANRFAITRADKIFLHGI